MVWLTRLPTTGGGICGSFCCLPFLYQWFWMEIDGGMPWGSTPPTLCGHDVRLGAGGRGRRKGFARIPSACLCHVQLRESFPISALNKGPGFVPHRDRPVLRNKFSKKLFRWSGRSRGIESLLDLRLYLRFFGYRSTQVDLHRARYRSHVIAFRNERICLMWNDKRIILWINCMVVRTSLLGVPWNDKTRVSPEWGL